MTNRKSTTPNINQVRTLKYDLIQKSKPKPDGFVIKSTNGITDVEVRPDGYYKFANHRQPITLLISKNRDEWPAFEIKSMAEGFVASFTKYAVLWLNAHNYGPISVRVIDSYAVPGAFSWQPSEAKQLRDRILSDFLAPSNTGKPVEQWKGLGNEPKNNSLAWLSGADSPKG